HRAAQAGEGVMQAFPFKPKRRKNGKICESRIWWGQWKLPGDAKPTRVSLKTTEKRVAQKRLDEHVRLAELTAAGMAPPPTPAADRRKLSEHLDDFIADLTARNRSKQYRDHVRNRCTALIAACGWQHPGQVTADSFVSWRSEQAEMAAKKKNQYLRSED